MSSVNDDEAQLTLEAVGAEAALLSERRKSFGPKGGTIGRSPINDWVLNDEFVSRQHARITCSGGQFFIEDTNSTGGVLLNGRRLFSGQPNAIALHDRLVIKPFAIEVKASPTRSASDDSRALSSANVAARKPGPPREAPPDDPLKTHLPPSSFAAPLPSSDDLDQWDVVPLLERLLDESALIESPRTLPPVAGPADVHRSQFKDTVEVPAAVARERPPVEQPPRAVPVVPNAPSATSRTTSLDQLLTKAGLDPAQVTPEAAQQMGEVLRVVIGGLLDVLQARQQAKEAFRIQGTMFRPRGNNPLKFSTDVDDALHNLFVKRGEGYLGPVEALDDVFNDLRNHQLAVVTAMKRAFQILLERLEPSALQKQFDESGKGKSKGRLGLLQGTPNPWALYSEWVTSLLHDPDGSFRNLFGEIFSREYEEALKRLRARSRPPDAR